MTADGELHLDPSPMSLGQTWVGFPATAHAKLTFASAAACDVTISVGSPFTVDKATAHLSGGSPLDLTLSLVATAPGAISSTVTIAGCGKQLAVPVTATAAVPPQCPAPAACATFVFSPDAGLCVTVPVADGTACSEACMVGTSCHGGECTGTALDCDDQDPCTLDTCSQSLGCQHLAAGTICPPLPGCGAVCDGGDCGTLREVWSVSVPPGWLVQPTVADDSGNVYWLENGGETNGALVSYDRNGALRYRVPVNLVNTDPRPMVALDVFTFTSDLGDLVTTYRTQDGALLWSRHLRDDLVAAGHGDLAGKFSYVDHGTIGANGELVYPIGFPDENQSYFIALDPQTGATLWRAQFGWGFWYIQSDESGQLYVQIAYGNGTNFAAFRPDGGAAWTSSEIAGPTVGGNVYTRGSALSAATGQLAYAFSSNQSDPPDLVLPHLGARRDLNLSALQLFDPADGHLLGQLSDPEVEYWSMFASADDELMALNAQAGELIAVDTQAQQMFTCHVPGDRAELWAGGAPTLIPGLLLVWTASTDSYVPDASTLHAFALPGRSGATHGWMSSGGSMSRANKPR